jgi:hypothetical protein
MANKERPTLLTEELIDIGCSCHTMPPCSFCTSMSEEEFNIFDQEGAEALRRYIRSLKNNE